MAFCLIPKLATQFKQMIKAGEIDISKLSDMSSEGRRAFFTEKLGDRNAKEVNALFESKLLLKNQKRGLVSWAKQITGMKPEVQRDLISRIEKMDKILNPEEGQRFLEDLASKRLGTDISEEEATKIFELSQKIKGLEEATDKTKPDVALGRAKLELSSYVNSLNPTKTSVVTNIAGLPRSLMASLDLSAPLNQGWGMLSRKEFYSSLGSMLKYAKNESNLLDLQAEILTHPLYKQAKKAGLRLTDLGTTLEKREEQFMSTLVDKIPGVSASQRAYTGFLNKLRMDVFSDLVNKADIAGEDIGIGSTVLEDLAKVVNNFTGGAKVGKIEGAVPMLNAAFFSPRKIVSTLNILNPVNYVNPKISKTARLAATRNLIGSAAISIGILNLYSLLTGGKLETDSRSTDFGKVRVGNSRLDLSGGNATYVTLLSRVLNGQTKNQAGDLKELGNKFGQTSKIGLVGQSLRYKFSPNLSLLVDSLTGANAIGEEKTVSQSVADRFKPMFLSSVAELLKDDTTNSFQKALLGIGALFGGGLNTYETKKSNKKSIPLKQ